MTDPKIFLKAPLAPTYTYFEGGARAEKTQFFGQNFQKRVSIVFSECSENQFGRPKKRLTKFLKFFENSHPLRENLRSAPGIITTNFSE